MLLFLSIMLCCSALKIHLLRSRIRILAYNFAWQFTTYSRQFLYRAVLLECINETIWLPSILYSTMTVLLEYIDRSLQFSNIAFNICFALPYYADIMLNAFNHPLCSKLRWYKGGFLLAIAIYFA